MKNRYKQLMTMESYDIGVIGGGAWGTALAQVQARAGRRVLLWAREAEVVQSVNDRRENTPFLPGVRLHEGVHATGDFTAAVTPDLLLLVTPVQHTRSVLHALGGGAALAGKTLVLCAKGIEIETGMLLSRAVAAYAPESRLAVLTGPTFAREVAEGLPAAVTVAAASIELAQDIGSRVGSRNFRPYASDDMTGAEIGGAVKNVLAIACGIVAGKAYGESARAALLTRGMAEMGYLAQAMGGRRETLMGMCGMGDLVLTANSMQSRNFSLGFALGEGKSKAEILGTRTAVTEGVHTARAIHDLTRRLGLALPIVDAVYAILHEDRSVDAVIDDLLARPFTKEI